MTRFRVGSIYAYTYPSGSSHYGAPRVVLVLSNIVNRYSERWVLDELGKLRLVNLNPTCRRELK